MADKDKISGGRLAKIIVENFLAVFMMASAVGFTMRSLQILGTSQGLYIYTVAFSGVFGLSAAGWAWKRESEDVQMPKSLSVLLEKLGWREEAEQILTDLWIPGVQTPRCIR